MAVLVQVSVIVECVILLPEWTVKCEVDKYHVVFILYFDFQYKGSWVFARKENMMFITIISISYFLSLFIHLFICAHLNMH